MRDLRDNLGLFFLCSGSVLSNRNVIQAIYVILNLCLKTWTPLISRPSITIICSEYSFKK